MKQRVENIIIPKAFTCCGKHDGRSPLYYFSSSWDGRRQGPFSFDPTDQDFQLLLAHQKEVSRYINNSLSAEFRLRKLPFVTSFRPIESLQRSRRRRLYFLLRPPLMVTDSPDKNRMHNHAGTSAFVIHADEEGRIHVFRQFRHVKEGDGDNSLLDLFSGDVNRQLIFVRDEIREALCANASEQVVQFLASAVENAFKQIDETDDIDRDWYIPHEAKMLT